jgi:hypothetical protein
MLSHNMFPLPVTFLCLWLKALCSIYIQLSLPVLNMRTLS